MRVVRILSARPRLIISMIVAGLVALLLPGGCTRAERLLLGWDAGVALYLVLAFQVMTLSTVTQIRHRARLEDDGAVAILVLTAAAALTSLGAIVAELGAPAAGATPNPRQLVLAIGTIFLSWSFTHVMFALHYAHEFYSRADGKGGLTFPDDEEPDYWDFVYSRS
jgi:uncharacterized membrane protein